MSFIEILGYIASILVAISLTMSHILKLRIINLLGAITFSIYGYLVLAYPVFIVNSFIVLINIYYLIKMYRNRDTFDVLVGKENIPYLNQFYDHYEKDMHKFFPKFNKNDLESKDSIFILRNMRPVNLAIYNKQDNGIVELLVDYAIPEYRDSLNGQFLIKLFKDQEIVVKTGSKDHIKYIKGLGFKRNESGLYIYDPTEKGL